MLKKRKQLGKGLLESKGTIVTWMPELLSLIYIICDGWAFSVFKTLILIFEKRHEKCLKYTSFRRDKLSFIILFLISIKFPSKW